jgi:hypothetical protein
MTGIAADLAGYAAVALIALAATGAELGWVIHSVHVTRRTIKEHK